jgi:hypothetical protein
VRIAEDARLMVRPFDHQDTSLVSVFAASNALIRTAAGAGPAAPGAIVEVMLLDGPVGNCPDDRACAPIQESIRMARKSFTLVSVGPVITESPSAVKKPWPSLLASIS